MTSRTATAILTAFNRLIVEHDFQKISVEMIMAEASVSRSMFHEAFAGLVEGRQTAGRFVTGKR